MGCPLCGYLFICETMSSDDMRVAVLTSGGDSPGMNACIRAVVRVGSSRGLQVIGVIGGFEGILDRQFVELTPRSVARIIHRGGTFLTTGRSEEFRAPEGQERAAAVLDEERIGALIAIGGDGTMQGLAALKRVWDGLVIGIPGTIDNDLYGTDFSIGFDTAVNNALSAIDKIRDTADAYARVFLIEVMGRRSGEIALHVGIASGAEAVVIPETPTDLEAIAARVRSGRRRGRKSTIIVVAEGDEAGDATTLAARLTELLGERCRVSVLGYIQRGGNPTHLDRVLATRLGVGAVEAVLSGRDAVMVGEVSGKIVFTPLEQTWTRRKPIDRWMLEVLEELAS